MIKFEINNGKGALEMKGNAETLFNEMISFVKIFHSGIKEKSKEDADFFEWFIRNELGHVVFDECDEDDKKKEESRDIADDIGELIENLEELVKLMKK